jgi:hypothetical protein
LAVKLSEEKKISLTQAYSDVIKNNPKLAEKRK